MVWVLAGGDGSELACMVKEVKMVFLLGNLTVTLDEYPGPSNSWKIYFLTKHSASFRAFE